MKDPKKARAIMIVVLLSQSYSVGIGRSLQRRLRLKMSFNGVDGDGIGINSDLSHRVDISQNLITVASATCLQAILQYLIWLMPPQELPTHPILPINSVQTESFSSPFQAYPKNWITMG